MRSASQKEIKSFIILTGIIGVSLFAVMTFFFGWRVLKLDGTTGDMDEHVRFAMDLPGIFDMGIQQFKNSTKYSAILGYPAWHILLCIGFRLLGSIRLACGLLNSFFIVSVYVVMAVIFYRELSIYKRNIIAPFMGLAMVFIGPLYMPVINEQYYLGQFTFNVWHNPTTIAVKPIAVLITYLYVLIVRDSLEKTNSSKKKFIWFAVLLVVSAFIKPSFFQGFLPAVTLFCILRFAFKPNMHTFFFGIKTALAILPVCFVALFQLAFSLGGGGGIGIKPFVVWNMWTDHIGGSFLISVLFPITMYGICFKRFAKECNLQIAALFFLSALAQFIVFYLKMNPHAGDFVWAVYLATGMLFIGTIIEWCNMRHMKIQKILCGAILFLHLASGFKYWVEYFVLRNM